MSSDPLNQFKRILPEKNVFVVIFFFMMQDHLYKTKSKIFEYCQLMFDMILTFKMCNGLIFITFSIHHIVVFILLTRRKTTEAQMHSANKYSDQLPNMSGYCCPDEIFNLFIIVL